MGDRYRYPRARSPTLYNPARASLPLDAYRDYPPPSPIRSDHLVHATPRREVIPGPRSSNSSITTAPVTTTTYKISADPISRTSSVREGSRGRRSTLDGPANKPVIPTVVTYKPRDKPVVHAGPARPPSPLQYPYSGSQEEYYAVPASSGRGHHHRPRYSATMDNADMNRLSSERDSAHHLRAGAPPAHAYPRARPVYSGPVVRDTADYADDGYGYTTPQDLVRWDLNNATVAPRHGRNPSYDRGRPTSITGYSDIAPVRPVDNRPPVSTRGFDKIPQTARIAPSTYDRDRDRLDSRLPGPPPIEPVRPVAALDGPRRGDSTSLRPATYYHERERRGSNRDDYYEARDDEPRYRSERHRHDRRDNVVEQRTSGTRLDREEATRPERHERVVDVPRELRSDKGRYEDDYKDHKRHDDVYKDHKRHDDDYKDHKRHEEDPKDRKDTKDHKARDAAVAGLSLAGAALGVKAFKESADDHDDRRRDYDDESRRRRDPRDDKDSGERNERRYRENSPLRDSKDRPSALPLEIVEPPAREPNERHGSRSGRDSDPDLLRRPVEGPLNGSAIETESSTSDETQQRRSRPRRESGPGFNPRNTSDLKALKEALNKDPAPPTQQTPPKRRAESMGKDSQALTEIRSDVQSESGALRILTPAPTGADSKPQVKSILRAPREKFPEDPTPIREGVAPLKDAKKKDGVPPSARWTKISRKLVNPEALELGKERYEAREDFVIVLRVLSRDEVQTYAEVTERIRSKSQILSYLFFALCSAVISLLKTNAFAAAREEAEEEEERAARRRARRERHERHKRRRESGGESHRTTSHSQRYSTRDQDFHSESDTTSDSAEKGDKVRSSKDRDRPRTKAIEAGPVMSGALGGDDKKLRGDEKKASSSKAEPAVAS